MTPAIVVTHGMLGAELLKAASQIYGPLEDVTAVSNEGCSLDALRLSLEDSLGDADAPIFVFVDVLGGSCCHAGLALRAAHPRVRLVAGVNLPMILEFLHHRASVDTEELLERVLSRGRAAVRVP
jgi:mannose/fructose-specific phosphotransferase system component IIA